MKKQLVIEYPTSLSDEAAKKLDQVFREWAEDERDTPLLLPVGFRAYYVADGDREATPIVSELSESRHPLHVRLAAVLILSVALNVVQLILWLLK